MDISLLDNPCWHSLNSHHQHLAIPGKISARYREDVFFAAALEKISPEAFDDLRKLVAVDGAVALILEEIPQDIPGWELIQVAAIFQMVCEDFQPQPPLQTVNLTSKDVPEMLQLVELTHPGPFLPSTIQMGQYIGLRDKGTLVAVAGERVHLPGFCEISSVCTHPDFRERGYGGSLTAMLAENIIARQEVPFLHLVSSNYQAIKLYEKLGFRKRKKANIAVFQRID